MWVQTPYGYTSAVAHKRKPGCVLVRGRERESLVHFCKLAGIPDRKIHTDMPSDYPFRVIAKRSQYATYLVNAAEGITYTNFKTEAQRVRPAGGYVHFLHQVWSASQQLTPPAVKRKNWDAWDAHDKKHKLGRYAPQKERGRWGTFGAWANRNATPPALPAGRVEPAADEPLPSLQEVLEMTDDEREDKLRELDERLQGGDDRAGDLLDEVDRLLPPTLDEDEDEESESLFKSVHAMTEEEYLRYVNVTGGI